jgi:hypothetical protein
MLRNRFLILNFFAGTVFLALLFRYTLSLSLGESSLFAVVLSFLYTSALALWRKPGERRESQFLKSPVARSALFFLVLYGFGVIFFGLIHLVFAGPGTPFLLIKGLGVLFLVGASALFLVAALWGKEEGRAKKAVYSWRDFLRELSASLLVFAVAYSSGVGLGKSVSMALYVFVLAGWYYSMMVHRYEVPGRVLKIRAVVAFIAVTSGLYLFVIGDMALSVLVGALFAVAFEKDYRITRKLVEEGLLERRHTEGGASRLFYGVFYGFGAMAALMVATGNYTTSFIREALLAAFRLLYLFTAVFLPFGTLIGWLRLKVYCNYSRQA